MPFAAEFAALERLGVAAAALAPLRPFVDSGVPTSGSLAKSYLTVVSKIASPVLPASAGGGTVDKLIGEVQGLVKVRKAGETPSGAPAPAVPRIEAALAVGDFAGATAAIGELPESARAPAADWIKAAEARLAAETAAEGLVRDAIAELGATRK